MSETQQKAVSGTATVVVGCKLPHGYTCELGRPGEEKYTRVKLKGANDSKIIGGYGLTDVDESFMAAWMKKHSRLTPVVKNLIFIQSDLSRAQAHAIDNADRKTGLEKLTPKDLPKGVKQFNPKD